MGEEEYLSSVRHNIIEGIVVSDIKNNNNNNKNNEPIPLLEKKKKKKRNLPGNPDPSAEVVALSPETLMASKRFECEMCGKGFQREQNLQLHRRGHNLPWNLKQREEKRRRVYVCPEKGCVHHQASRALGDLTGIKKHFSRKHFSGEKKWKCLKCSKLYALHSDWKAHSKTCGTRDYNCHCGTVFSRRDSFITHRAFCDALAQETAKLTNTNNIINTNSPIYFSSSLPNIPNNIATTSLPLFMTTTDHYSSISSSSSSSPPFNSATALLQKAALIGSTMNTITSSSNNLFMNQLPPKRRRLNVTPNDYHQTTRDFLGTINPPWF